MLHVYNENIKILPANLLHVGKCIFIAQECGNICCLCTYSKFGRHIGEYGSIRQPHDRAGTLASIVEHVPIQYIKLYNVAYYSFVRPCIVHIIDFDAYAVGQLIDW